MEDDEDSAPHMNLDEAWLVSDFMEACPSKGYVPPLPSEILRDMPALRKFVEAHPELLRKNIRRVLLQLIVDMAVDNVLSDKFVEFGVFVLDRCAIEGVAQFFDRFNEESFMNFINNELFKYLITGSEHANHLLRGGIRKVWCSNDSCPYEGIFCCSRCVRKLNVRVFYCSKKCQKEHYPSHRPYCGKTLGRENMCMCEIREDYLDRMERKYWRKREENKKASGAPKKTAPGNVDKKNSKSGSKTEGTSVSRESRSSGGADSNKEGVSSSPGKKVFKRGFLK